jgi:hypothetical protein
MKTLKISTIIIILFLLVGLNSTAQQPEIDNILFSTGSAAGTWWTIGAGISEKVNEFFQGYPFTATPGPGSVGNPPVISAGDAHFGMSYGPFLVLATEGQAPYDKKFDNLRAVCTLTPTVVHVFVTPDIEADSVEELIEKKIKINMGIPPTGQGSNYIAQIMFSAMGYDNLEGIKEYGSKLYYASGSDLVAAWKDRQTNATISTYNVPASALEESLMGREGKILDIGEGLFNELVDNRGFSEYIIPAGTYPGQERDVKTVALPIVIITREDTSDEVVYNLAKAIYENKDYLVSVHNSFNEFNPDKMATGTGIQLHKGAIKFYEEIDLIK